MIYNNFQKLLKNADFHTKYIKTLILTIVNKINSKSNAKTKFRSKYKYALN